jgi:hypothetical protein
VPFNSSATGSIPALSGFPGEPVQVLRQCLSRAGHSSGNPRPTSYRIGKCADSTLLAIGIGGYTGARGLYGCSRVVPVLAGCTGARGLYGCSRVVHLVLVATLRGGHVYARYSVLRLWVLFLCAGGRMPPPQSCGDTDCELTGKACWEG